MDRWNQARSAAKQDRCGRTRRALLGVLCVLLAGGTPALPGCGPITIEIMPKHYHSADAAPQTGATATDAQDADALDPNYVQEQANRLLGANHE